MAGGLLHDLGRIGSTYMSISPSALDTAWPKMSNLMKRSGSSTIWYKYGAGGRGSSCRVAVRSLLSVAVRDLVAGCQLSAVMFLGRGVGIPRAGVRKDGRKARERSSMFACLDPRKVDHVGDPTNETLKNESVRAHVRFGLFFCMAEVVDKAEDATCGYSVQRWTLTD